jgi:cell shape-determining protein MreD
VAEYTRLLRRPTLRLVPAGIVLIAFQRAILADLRVTNVVLEIVLAFAAACGVAAGPEKGAYAGFVLGLMFDLGTGALLGQHGLAFGIGAYVAGFVTLVAVDPHWWLSMTFVVLGGAAGELTIPIVQTFVRNGGWQGSRISIIVPVVAGFCGLLSPLFIPVGRWCMCVRRRVWKVPAG